MKERLYVPKCNAKEITFKDGGSLIRIGCHVESLIAFVRQNANEQGYVNLVVTRRREPGKYGETHAVYLDDWKPQPKARAPAADDIDPPI